MPIPVSVTEMTSLSLFPLPALSIFTVTVPFSVNLTAFPIKFTTHCLSLVSSPLAETSSSLTSNKSLLLFFSSKE